MRLLLISLLIFVSISSHSQIVINEYSAANFDDFADNYGDNEDWFELYNSSAATINLNGYYLSDKEDNLTKWQFSSDVNINPNEHLIVFCSGRNEINGNNIHTSFKLHQTKNNEWIILTDPDGLTVVDSVFIRPCLTNSSRGRMNYTDDTKAVFTNPTPGAINTNGFVDYSSTPTFNPIAGIHAAPINVSITADPGNTIYYTTDGSLPDDSDNLYNGPIAINNTTVLKAVAYSNDPDILPSFMEYGTYFIGVSHSMKILSISGRESDNLANPELYELIAGGQQIEPNGTFEIYNSDGSLFDKARGEFNEHGNDSWAYAQRGFDYITRDQFGYNYAIKGEVFNDIDRDRFQRFIVKCAANDNYPFSYGSSGAHIRDAYVQSLSQVANLRLDERSHESCVMYLNGEYWGVYELREKVDDLDYTDIHYDQDSVAFLKTWGGTWVDVLTDDQDPNTVVNSWDDIRNYITGNDMAIQANYDYAKDRYNVGSLIDYYILNSYTVNADWLNWNTAWWKGLEEDGDKKKWRYALWDMDNTFDHGANYTNIPNTDPDADPCDAETLGNIGGQGHIPIWNALIQNEEFFDDYINRWSNLSNSYLSCEFMIQHLDSLIGIIEPEMQDQIDTWGGTYNEWMDNVNFMKDFMNERCTFLNAAIVDCYDVEGPFDVTIVIEGIGEVDFNNFFDINQTNTPFSGEYFGGINIDFSVANGNFSYYEIVSNENYNYNETDTDFSLELQGDITIIFYFDANEITFLVEPTGSGNISIDGTSITSFPYTQSYIDNSNIMLGAQPNLGWEMGYWSSTNHSFSPTTTDENVNIIANNSDTVVLHLNQQTFDITYILEPSNADIEFLINGNNISTFPYTTTEFYGTNISLEAKSNINWEFLYFTSNNGGYISGQSISPLQGFSVNKSDTITIYYDANIFYDVSYQVFPEGSGQIRVQNINIEDSTITYPYMENVNLEAIPTNGWRFSHWDYQNNKINPDENAVYSNFTVESPDAIRANFKELFEVFVPNSFTPANDDNMHNTFEVSIFSIEGVNYEFEVFNRFGETIFYSNDETISWDGSYKNGGQVPSGVYIYTITVESLMTGKTFQKKGSITLLR
jgi:gliding motility-associated-like protein